MRIFTVSSDQESVADTRGLLRRSDLDCRGFGPDHLITLLQFNTIRALATNRTLISGILTTPLDCYEEVAHVIPYPSHPQLVPPQLLPTALQQTVPHGDWIDLFPSPEGRDRLILAVAAGSLDEDELWADCIGGLYEGLPDAAHVDGDAGVERHGMIVGSPPWDIRGWEITKGSLEKWGRLFGDLPGGDGGDDSLAEGEGRGAVIGLVGASPAHPI
ncbi:hypothetical protein ALT_5980 [Aspergillus lentulus]|uniref:Uncharacterized protein n=1 Tax=Aspergillus lentulus TaxID=293939 RepID=A0AAN4PLZ6_ASPLE|nr:hypothetical protein ALT_5980 [Aspergillus lentulus]